MKLASKDGQSFEMRILQYQFPHLETEEYDSNGLIVAGDIIHPKGSSATPVFSRMKQSGWHLGWIR